MQKLYSFQQKLSIVADPLYTPYELRNIEVSTAISFYDRGPL